MVVRYPAGSVETPPVAGTTYANNDALGLGTVIQTSTATTFTASGLTPATAYDFYI